VKNNSTSVQTIQFETGQRRYLCFCLLVVLMFFGLNTVSAQTAAASEGQDDNIEQETEVVEEVNTNDPTAAAISISAGFEFFSWHEDEIAPGQTRPTGNDNSFNSRIVIPMPKGKWGSPWPIINRFSFSNVEAPGGTSASGNAEFITLFIPKTWATGKIGIGPAINLPADEKQFGTDVWRFGFSAVFLENSFGGRLMWGALMRQVWGKTDPNSNETLPSAFAFQPIAVLQLNNGWYISNGESPISYHWQDKQWLIPMGFRLGKTLKDNRGGTWNMYGEYRTNIVYKDWKGAAASDIIRISASYTFSTK
jgi:hypothetical protein